VSHRRKCVRTLFIK